MNRDCWCNRCMVEEIERCGVVSMHMPVCPECGDKRCARAEDHRNECGGRGTAAEAWKAPVDVVLPTLAAMLKQWQGRRLLGGRDEVDIGESVARIRDAHVAVKQQLAAAINRAEAAAREQDEVRTSYRVALAAGMAVKAEAEKQHERAEAFAAENARLREALGRVAQRGCDLNIPEGRAIHDDVCAALKETDRE